MVKVKLLTSKKSYQRGKRIYKYTRPFFPVPSRLLSILEPYFEEEFQADMRDEESKVTVTFTYLKKPKKQIK